VFVLEHKDASGKTGRLDKEMSETDKLDSVNNLRHFVQIAFSLHHLIMRTYFIILLLINIKNVSAQKLFGTYNFYGIGGESITFHNKKKFSFSGDNCTWNYSGKGTYKLVGNQLFLYFEKKAQPVPTKKKETIIKKDSIKADGFNFKINVIDNSTNKPVSESSVHIIGTKIGALTDKKGNATVNAESGQSATLLINKLDCLPDTVFLYIPGVYSISVFKICGGIFNRKLNNGETFTYEFANHGDDFIEMIHVYSTGEKSGLMKYIKKEED